MYLLSVVLLLLVAPAVSIAVEMLLLPGQAPLILLVGKWFTFWAGGVRLLVAGLRQTFQPGFTANAIFGLKDAAAFPVVREIGFGNLSMGTLGVLSLLVPSWTVTAALVSGLYYGLAGVGHLMKGERNFKEQTALISDLLICVLLLGFVATQMF